VQYQFSVEKVKGQGYRILVTLNFYFQSENLLVGTKVTRAMGNVYANFFSALLCFRVTSPYGIGTDRQTNRRTGNTSNRAYKTAA